MGMADDEIRASQAARILGVHRSTVHRWAKAGRLPVHRRLPSGQKTYSRAQVTALGESMKKSNRMGRDLDFPGSSSEAPVGGLGRRQVRRETTVAGRQPLQRSAPRSAMDNDPRFVRAATTQTAPAGVQPRDNATYVANPGGEVNDDYVRMRVAAEPARYAAWHSADGNYIGMRREGLITETPGLDLSQPSHIGATLDNIMYHLMAVMAAHREHIVGGNPANVYNAFGINLNSLGNLHALFPIAADALHLTSLRAAPRRDLVREDQVEVEEPTPAPDPFAASSDFSVAESEAE